MLASPQVSQTIICAWSELRQPSRLGCGRPAPYGGSAFFKGARRRPVLLSGWVSSEGEAVRGACLRGAPAQRHGGWSFVTPSAQVCPQGSKERGSEACCKLTSRLAMGASLAQALRPRGRGAGTARHRLFALSPQALAQLTYTWVDQFFACFEQTRTQQPCTCACCLEMWPGGL